MCTAQYIEHYQKIIVVISLAIIHDQHLSPDAEQTPDYYLHKEIFFSPFLKPWYVFWSCFNFS